MLKRFNFIQIFVLFFTLSALAKNKDFAHSKASVLVSHDSISDQEPFDVALLIELEPGWHTYWINPGDSGASPKMELSSNLQSLVFSSLDFPPPVRIETPPLTTYGYENEVVFRTRVFTRDKTHLPSKISLSVRASWLVCHEVCIPNEGHWTIVLPVAKRGIRSKEAWIIEKYFPKNLSAIEGTYTHRQNIVSIEILKKQNEILEDFFIQEPLQLSFQKPDIQTNSSTYQLKTTSQNGFLPNQKIMGLALFKTTNGTEHRLVTLSLSNQTNERIWLFVLFALIGGLILNLMPCVFPVISIKFLSILNQAKSNPREIKWQSLSYVLGVVLSFISFALILALIKKAGLSLGWGFQLQSPYFLIFLIFLFVYLAFVFLGLDEIYLPSRFSKASSHVLTQFWTGVLAVLVASPCTAPFMGVAMGFALSQNTFILISIFLALGIGFALPYVMFAIRPSLVYALPKPGPWLDHFKKFMFFPMIFTSLWLIWVFGKITSHTSSMMVLGALVLWSIAFWLKHEKLLVSFSRWPLFALSVLLALYSIHFKSTQNQNITQIQWENFSLNRIEALESNKQSYFINFTASWCITCQINKRITFANSEIAHVILEKKLVMIEADWTKKDPVITQALAKHNRISVPFYVFYNGATNTKTFLPEILSPGIFRKNVLEKLN